jgi:hypothetical protein
MFFINCFPIFFEKDHESVPLDFQKDHERPKWEIWKTQEKYSGERL